MTRKLEPYTQSNHHAADGTHHAVDTRRHTRRKISFSPRDNYFCTDCRNNKPSSTPPELLPLPPYTSLMQPPLDLEALRQQVRKNMENLDRLFPSKTTKMTTMPKTPNATTAIQIDTPSIQASLDHHPIPHATTILPN